MFSYGSSFEFIVSVLFIVSTSEIHGANNY